MCHKNICYDSKLTCVLSPGSMSHINIYYVQQMQHVEDMAESGRVRAILEYRQIMV